MITHIYTDNSTFFGETARQRAEIAALAQQAMRDDQRRARRFRFRLDPRGMKKYWHRRWYSDYKRCRLGHQSFKRSFKALPVNPPVLF